jgi:hypothetical protein
VEGSFQLSVHRRLVRCSSGCSLWGFAGSHEASRAPTGFAEATHHFLVRCWNGYSSAGLHETSQATKHCRVLCWSGCSLWPPRGWVFGQLRRRERRG